MPAFPGQTGRTRVAFNYLPETSVNMRAKKQPGDAVAPYRPLLDTEFDAIMRMVATRGDTIEDHPREGLGPARPPQVIYARIDSDPNAARKYNEAKSLFASMLL